MRQTLLRLTLGATIVLVLGVRSGAAQELVTLERAVQDAVAQNASLRAARAGAAEAAAEATAARSGWYPRVSFSEHWQRGNDPVFVFSSLLASRAFTSANFAIDALNHPAATGFFRTSVGVEQRLFDGGRQRATTDAAALRRAIAELDANGAAAAIVVSTTETFGRIVTMEAESRAVDAARAAAREDLARAEHRRDAGVATDADVLSLVTYLASLEQRSIRLQGDAAIAQAELNRLVGAKVDRPIAVVAPSPGAADAATPNALVDLLEEAARQRPEIARAELEVRLADLDDRGARATLLPQVAAQAGADFSGLSIGSRTSAWTAGASLQWTFSLGGEDGARIRAAREARARASAELEAAHAAVDLDVVTALRQVETATARLSVSRAAVRQAQETQRIVRDRFDAGLTSVADVLRASTAVLEAESQRVSAEVDTLVSAAMVDRAVGRGPGTRRMP